MAASKQLLSVQSLQHSAGGKVLFRDISFGVQESDRIGLIGPNGAGKSTLLRILTGSLTPDSGEVVRRRGLQVACLAQNPKFSETESIYDALSGGAHSTPDSEIASWEWISKLSLDTYSPDTPVKTLSGGWKKRVALGRELVRSPDLLLLDEPTNHLDVQSILWLEDFLQDLPCAVVLVTHDRLFLQRVSKKIFDLDPRNPQGLLKIDGDYLAYREAKELLMAGELQKEWKLANLLRRETDWLRRGAKARQTKQRARQESAAELADQVQELRQQNHRRKLDLEFGAAEAIPKKLIEARKVSLFREVPEAPRSCLFKDLDLILGRGTRLGLLGSNGCGKSSLIRVLLGEETPSSGEVRISENIQVAHFEQSRDQLDPKASVLKNICPFGDFVQLRGQPVHARSYLERFLFRFDQMDLPVGRLSGGEQARLRMAQLMLQPASILVLDEPTNDLDLETLQVLEDSIHDFAGAVLLVTHDRYFLDQVVTEILAFPEDGSGELTRYASVLQWEMQRDQQKEQQKGASSVASAKVEPGIAAPVSKSTPRVSKKELQRLEQLEKKIADLELQQSLLTQEMQQMGSEPQKLLELQSRLEVMQSQHLEYLGEWESLALKIASLEKNTPG